MKLTLFTPAANISFTLESAEGGHVSQAKIWQVWKHFVYLLM